ncbi:aminotransferase class V-fold PLP-dependent enzyme [Candidatus Nomurabacteria bacterium]|nr:aminotransferase class V-fold PLP-dependent enzyme [Candidatus Nomurabacteria bacterium]
MKRPRPKKTKENLPRLRCWRLAEPKFYTLLEKRGFARITIVPVETNGIVSSKKIKEVLKNNTILVSVMYANNEIGTIQPIKEIAKEIRHYKKTIAKSLVPNTYPVFHTDAVQAANYLDLNVEKLGIDLLTLSGSKIEGAGRVGVLYKKNNVSISRIMGGGDQELGLRPGTENLAEILKFSSAFKEMDQNKDKEVKRLTLLRDYFFNQLEHSHILKNVGMLVNGDLVNRLPNSVSITIPTIPSDLLVIELSSCGIMTSSKSACKSSKKDGSYVIEALRPSSNPEIGGVRFSFGKGTNKKDIDYTVASLEEILTKLKKWYN